MINLRKLKLKDAEYMLEWMKDPAVNAFFNINFAEYTQEKVLEFISESFNDVNQHFAVVNEEDEYMGTISLKNISNVDKNAEYAVAFRSCAHGKGMAKEATEKLLKYGFKTLGLNKIYLNVLMENIRARKFYDKMDFFQEGVFRKHILVNGKFQDLCWYSILREDYEKNRCIF